ncbi:MAG: hypothetical protein ACR2IV_19985 [Bryobacteraceae bacterium]
MFSEIYYGVPRFVGALFRATKIPSIILLIGLVGVPVVTSAYLTGYAVKNHSTFPLDLFVVGLVQFQLETNPGAAVPVQREMEGERIPLV